MKQKILNINDFEKLSDLGLITAVSLFLPIEAVERDPKYAPRVFFVFRKSSELEKIARAYWEGQLTVNAQEFFNQIKKIKARIHGDQ